MGNTGTNLCSYTPMFLQPMFLHPYVPTPLCSDTPKFLHPYLPTLLYVCNQLFVQFWTRTSKIFVEIDLGPLMINSISIQLTLVKKSIFIP